MPLATAEASLRARAQVPEDDLACPTARSASGRAWIGFLA